MLTVPRTSFTAFCASLVLLLQFAPSSADGQVIPSLQTPPRIAVFSTFTTAKPDFRHFHDNAVYGISLGGFIQTRHIVGIEVRGSILRWGGSLHQESGLGGVRAGLHRGHFSPYVDVLGGAANAWYWNTPPVKGAKNAREEEAVGPEWSILGGLDVHFHHRIDLRVGEFSYSKIYMTDRTLTSLSATAGFVYRLPIGR